MTTFGIWGYLAQPTENASELDLWYGLFRVVFEFEILDLAEAEGARHKIAGELLHAVVLIPRRTVVIATGHLDFVFQFVEVLMQEVFIEQAAQALVSAFSALAEAATSPVPDTDMERARASLT